MGSAFFGYTDESSGQKIEFYWRNDWFVTYLMWQSKRGVPSVPVALKYATWDWFGRAYVVSTSTSPWTYDGWQPFTEIKPFTGLDIDTPPYWTSVPNPDGSQQWTYG